MLAAKPAIDTPDVALSPLNDKWKFFLAHLPFSTHPSDVRDHFSVSLPCLPGGRIDEKIMEINLIPWMLVCF
jgi:hypothetical protein